MCIGINYRQIKCLVISAIFAVLIAGCGKKSDTMYAQDKVVQENANAMNAFEAFVQGKECIQIENKDYYYQNLVEREIEEFYTYYYDADMTGMRESIETGESTWDDYLQSDYVGLVAQNQPIFLLDIKVIYPNTGHRLYQIVYQNGRLCTKAVLELSWCDFASAYEDGIIEIDHGQHFPAVSVFLDATEPIFASWTETKEKEALLVVAGPKEWTDEEEYKDYAKQVYIFSEGEDYADITSKYFGNTLKEIAWKPVKSIFQK